MINVSFYLNNQKIDKSGQSPVYMLLTFNGQRIRKAVRNVKVSKSEWNVSRSRVKAIKSDEVKLHESFNSRLESIEETVHKINKTVLKFDIPLNKEYILSKIENPESIELTKRNFFSIVDEYIRSIKGVKAERTVTGSRTAFNFLKGFQDSKKYALSFETIDLRFFEAFRNYSYEEKEIANNYFVKIISTLKTFMTWAMDRGYHANDQFRKFKVAEVENEVIYMTLEELLQLNNFEFDSNRLSHVRDLYCFSCFTGLRFSDAIALDESHIQGENIIKSIQKTKQANSKIPLSKYAKAILEKYKDSIHYPLPKISNQKFNSYIKECCELAGINSSVSIVRFSGGKRTELTFPKHQLITSHTARKTFVTNSLILGMKEMVVRNITGHKKEESFKKYVKIAEDVKRQEMESTWNSL